MGGSQSHERVFIKELAVIRGIDLSWFQETRESGLTRFKVENAITNLIGLYRSAEMDKHECENKYKSLVQALTRIVSLIIPDESDIESSIKAELRYELGDKVVSSLTDDDITSTKHDRIYKYIRYTFKTINHDQYAPYQWYILLLSDIGITPVTKQAIAGGITYGYKYVPHNWFPKHVEDIFVKVATNSSSHLPTAVLELSAAEKQLQKGRDDGKLAKLRREQRNKAIKCLKNAYEHTNIFPNTELHMKTHYDHEYYSKVLTNIQEYHKLDADPDKARSTTTKPSQEIANAVDANAVDANAVSDNAVSDKAVSDKALSDNAVSDNAVSDNAVSDNAVSDNAVSDKAVSDKAVSDKAVDAPLVAPPLFGPTTGIEDYTAAEQARIAAERNTLTNPYRAEPYQPTTSEGAKQLYTGFEKGLRMKTRFHPSGYRERIPTPDSAPGDQGAIQGGFLEPSGIDKVIVGYIYKEPSSGQKPPLSNLSKQVCLATNIVLNSIQKYYNYRYLVLLRIGCQISYENFMKYSEGVKPEKDNYYTRKYYWMGIIAGKLKNVLKPQKSFEKSGINDILFSKDLMDAYESLRNDDVNIQYMLDTEARR